MRHEFTAVYEGDDEWGSYLILEDHREEGLRGVPAGAERKVITGDVQAA